MPFGNLDVADGGDALIRLAGWSIDPETAAPIGVHAYVDGQFAGGAGADVLRPDVGAAFAPFGPHHGYDFTVPARPGPHDVCTYAINIGAGDVNPQLACRATHVRMPAACGPIQSEIAVTQAEIAALQAELRSAPTSQKATLVAQIRALNSRVASLRTHLARWSRSTRGPGGLRARA